MKVKFRVKMDYAGCENQETIELPDELTDEEIEEEWKDWVWNVIDGHWERVDDDEQ